MLKEIDNQAKIITKGPKQWCHLHYLTDLEKLMLKR